MYSFSKKIFHALLPARIRDGAKPFLRSTVSFFYRGNEVECSVCGFSARRFIQESGSSNRICPRCGSLDRKRLLWLYLKRTLTSSTDSGIRLLHFSPSDALYYKISTLPRIDYVATDLADSSRPYHFSINAIPFNNEHFDLIICYHVLEHVSDDKGAMAELYRVCRRGGKVLVQVPFTEGETVEDQTITSPEERLALFGQEDHVRLYGRIDFIRRLARAGFKVKELKCGTIATESEIRNFALQRDELIFMCEK